MTRFGPQRFWFAAGLSLLAAVVLTPAESRAGDADVVRPTTDFSKPEKYEALPAGALTSQKRPNAHAFSQPSANMAFNRQLDFQVGDGFFRRLWVSAPASTKLSDGLGPHYNARACQRCHLKDGRGHPPEAMFAADNAISMLLRLSIPPRTPAERRLIESGRAAVIPEPVYGGQLQDSAIQSHRAEGRIAISYATRTVTLRGGQTITLQKPAYRIAAPAYGKLHPDTMISPRIAPQMIGLGLLEAIADTDIRTSADPNDRNGDGISGRINTIWSESRKRLALGRFGWKAGKATVEDQSAGAFAGDMGLSTPLHPQGFGDCTASQTECRAAPDGSDRDRGNVEVSRAVLDLVAFYTRNLAVPMRRDYVNRQVLAGKRLFYGAGCIACHRPKFITQTDPPGLPEQSRQLIWPYTDMLLHDMGNGLADNRPEARADGREWRTPPLWGIGLTETVSGHTRFLHDGRARNLTEAILWHDGEARRARDRFADMTASDRAAMIAFLNSL